MTVHHHYNSNEETLNKLVRVRETLCRLFVQREGEIDAILIALLSREPAILIGPPGLAKTALIDSAAEMIHAKVFRYLMTRFTEPDEILGPVDIMALRQGEYKRITEIDGNPYLPEADIVYLDEIFKASSAIRNVLLRALQEKQVIIGATTMPVKALTFYFSSNEISYDVEDQAFYDRMVIRDFVRPVGKDAWVDLLKAGVVLEDYKPAKLMTTEDIKRLQQLTVSVFKKLPGNEGIVRKAIEAFHELEQKGLWLSDRRKVKILKICAASSILHLENEPTLDSLADALRLCAPHDEDDVHKVEEVIVSCGLSVLTPHIQKLKTLEAEIRNALKRAKAERSLNAIKDLLLIRKKALLALKDIPPSPRLYSYIHTLKSLIEEAGDFLDRDDVLKEVLQK